MTDTTPERRHGRETFFIEGEGLVGGDAPDAARPVAARMTAARTTAAAAAAPPFRFSRMGPKGRRLGAEIRKKVGRAMTDAPVRNGEIPAGYTYLGQFVDHDLTFDATTVAFGERGRRRPTCSRAGRRRSTSTRCTARGRSTRSRRSSTRPTGCT